MSYFHHEKNYISHTYCYFTISNVSGAPIHVAVNRPDTPTELRNANVNANQITKIIKDGQLIIIREDKQYTAQGTITR